MRYLTGKFLVAATAAALMALPAGTAGAGAASTLSLIAGAEKTAPASQPLILAQYRTSPGYGPSAQRWGPAARDGRSYRGGRDHRGSRQYRGHRGYSDYRPGYRRHSDGWWYPAAAFALGAIIGSTAGRGDYSEAHHRWCDARYRSYRWSDGTFQPYNGPRRLCNSPYDGR